MKISARPFAGLALLALAGCASDRQAYAQKHPELSPAQREIFRTGRVTASDAVAGLTREQITVALGAATSFDKINGEDAWIYARAKPRALKTETDTSNTPGSSFERPHGLPDTDASGRELTYTTVYFHGDRATHAENTTLKP